MTLDRQRGCLMGLAVGDALGAAIEFRAPGTFKPVTGYRSGGPHGLAPGEWTDDTSMALALADSIACAGWDLNDQVNRYVVWWRQGEYSVNGTCFDIGITTRSALVRFLDCRDARRSGDSSERASGNGSIMRLAPVPIRYLDYFPGRIKDLADLAEESSLTTHASPQCLSACRYMALVLCGLLHGLDRDEVLSSGWEPLSVLRAAEPLHPAIDEVAMGSFRQRQPPQIKGSGHVVRSLEAALWTFHDAADFREAVLRAVNLGDDADTTGAVCGQFAGAYWGESGIPDDWRDGLARRDMVEKALAGLATSMVSLPVTSEAGDTARSSSRGKKPPKQRGEKPSTGTQADTSGPQVPQPNIHPERFPPKPLAITDAVIDAALLKIEQGLRKYLWIQANVHQCDVSVDRGFQKTFNNFYRVRRNDIWQQCYYALMESAKNTDITFRDALATLTRQTQRLEASFASKLVATLHPDKPVLDRFVLVNFGLRLPYFSAHDRESRTVLVYDELCSRYEVLLKNRDGEMICTKFRAKYPWAEITELKMIDLVLWQSR